MVRGDEIGSDMSAEPQEYVIADLLANSIEPWGNLTARELEALGAEGPGPDSDSPPTEPVVIAAYRNEHGPVLIDGSRRLRWLASPPRSRIVISAEDVRIDPAAVDEESARRAAVALQVNRRPAPPRVRAELARRLHVQFGWSHTTIAEVFKESRPAVADWLRQLSASDVPEVIGADGRIYPARGKQAGQDARASIGTVADALKVLNAEHQAVLQRLGSIRHIRIDRHGSSDTRTWTVAVPSRSGGEAADLANHLRAQANDLLNLARKLEQASS